MKQATIRSPRIISSGWGKMKIEGLGNGRDFKLWPGGGRAWDWGETGTRHSPGIQVSDIKELLEQNCRVIILTRGVFSRLKVPRETICFIEDNNIEAIVTSTKKGIQIYNNHIDRNIAVGGLFHSTC